MKSTSDDEFNAVSAESCSTPMMKPTATTCIAVPLSIPKRLQAKGMSIKEPPGTPAAPQAQSEATTERRIAVKTSTCTPNVVQAESARTVIVIAAPAMLMVAPRGIDTPKVSSGSFSLRHRFMLTGMFAADERVKNAITPDSRRVMRVSG